MDRTIAQQIDEAGEAKRAERTVKVAATARVEARLAQRLAAPGMRISKSRAGVWLESGDRRSALSAETLSALLARGALEPAADGFVLSEAGRQMVRRLASGNDFAAQHQERRPQALQTPAGCETVTVDVAESPLAWLRSRKDKSGQPIIDAPAFEAGERLRADFTRGQLMPRVTANWGATVANGRGGGDGVGNLTDAALSARLRVERALTAIGPELAGMAVDFCCFLKGLEAIESERGWPRRSAKLVLQFALSALARHYGLDRAATGRAGSPIRRWSDVDPQPPIG